MKVRLFTVALCLMALSFITNAQSLKIGYVKIEKVFAEWPEIKAADAILVEYEGNWNSRLQAKVKDLQAKFASYQQNRASMDAVTQKDTETELQNLQTQVQQFETNAKQSVSEKNDSLLKPLQNRLQEAIDEVAKENGFTHILNHSSSILFTSDKSGDISFKVAQKLGFTLSPDGQ